MKIKKISFILGIIYFLSLPNYAFAKEEIGIKAIDFRYEDGTASVFNFDNSETEFLDPQEHTDKFLLIRAGIETPTFVARKSKILFASTFKKDSCQVENLPGQKFPTGSINKVSLEKIKFLRECVKLKVEDPQKEYINFEGLQKNCEVTQVNDYTLIMSGGDCFVMAQPRQILNFSFYLEPNCQNKAYFVENGISPMEMKADVSAYIYPTKDLGPIFVPIKKLWQKNLFININSGKKLLTTVSAEDDILGRQFFRPTRMPFPDIFVSNLKLNNKQNSGFFDMGLLISTFGGSKICESGLCSSYSNYDVPLAPEIILFEKNRYGKKIELGSTKRNGDRFTGQWNGEYRMTDLFFGFPFEKGKKYSLELKFSDPVEDYNQLKKAYKSLLRTGGLLSIGSLRPGVDSLDTLSTFSGLAGGIGTVPGLSSSADRSMFNGISWDLNNPIPAIVTSLKDSTFPPLYSEVCNKEMTICKKVNSKEIAKILIDFEVIDVNDQGLVTLGDNIMVERVSELTPYSKYNLDLKNKPIINCKDL